MIVNSLKSYVFILLLVLATGCKEKEDEIPIDTLTLEDYIGKYSGEIYRERMAENGWIMTENAVVDKVSTEVIITPIEGTHNGLMVYVSAYNDSISTQLDPELGYLWITDKQYSFYLRTNDFPRFDGIYDHAVSTYGRRGKWEEENILTFGISFLKDLNDSIFICSATTKKINL